MRNFYVIYCMLYLNLLRRRRNGLQFADEIFKCIFLNENVWLSISISLKFVPHDPINNILALVQIMAWRRLGDKPLFESIVDRLPTRSQWVNPSESSTELWNTFELYTMKYLQLYDCLSTLEVSLYGSHYYHIIYFLRCVVNRWI